MNRINDHVTIGSYETIRNTYFANGYTIRGVEVSLVECISAADSFIRESGSVILKNVRHIYGVEWGLYVDQCSGLTIDTCEFCNVGTNNLVRGGVAGVGLRLQTAKNVHMANSECHHCNWDGMQTVQHVADVVIDDCDFHDNGAIIDGKLTTHGDGLNTAGFERARIRDCRFRRNGRNGMTIKKFLQSSQPGWVNGETGDIDVQLCEFIDNGTLYGPRAQGLHIEEAPGYVLTDVVIADCIWYGQANAIATEGEVTIYSPKIKCGDGVEGNGIIVGPSPQRTVISNPNIWCRGKYGIDFRIGSRSMLIGGEVEGVGDCEWGIVRRVREDLEIVRKPKFVGAFKRGKMTGE